ncbi:MAG TPA: proton-conducting transporter membrane subunit [Micromonosporaceae bacterium]
MNEDPLALLPEAVLLAGAVATLLAGAFLPRTRQWLARVLAVAALVGTVAAAVVAAGGPHRTVYGHSYALDAATSTARLLVPAAALLVVAMAVGRVAGSARETEFYVLVLLSSLGAVVLAGASDLLLLAVGYLLASIPLYGLAGWGRDRRGAEGALKLYLLGVLLGIGMLAGVAVLYGVGGATDYDRLAAGLDGAPPVAVAVGVVAVLGGLLFKMGAVPAHFWVPDAVQGATVPAAAVLTTIPKIGGLLAAYRLLVAVPDRVVAWPVLLAVVAAVTMTLGNFAAFGQSDPARLLAYSTISQVGYLLMAVAVAGRSDRALPALLVYLVGYTVTNLGAFAVLAAEPRNSLDGYRGLAARRPGLAGALVVCLLGLVGTPPTAVFAGKLSVFVVAWDGGMAWLVAVAAVNTVASLFYYLRWLVPAFSAEPGPPGRLPAVAPARRSTGWVAVVGATAAVVVVVVAAPLYQGVQDVLVR